jgi:transposase
VRHIVALLAMRRTTHGSGLGRWRWVVERTFAWLNQFRRLRVRYDKRADIQEAFLSLGCAWICWQSLRSSTTLLDHMERPTSALHLTRVTLAV